MKENISVHDFKKNVKSFPTLTAHRAALISVSKSPQPDAIFYAVRPRIRGQRNARWACLRPSGEAGTKLYCLVTEAHVSEQPV